MFARKVPIPKNMDYRNIVEKYFANGERYATTKEVRAYIKEMGEKGIPINVDKKLKVLKQAEAGFNYGKGEIFIKKNPGKLDLYHEGYHAEQYISLGRDVEKNTELGRLAREEHVYQQIMKNKSLFNEAELKTARTYIEYLRLELT